MGTEIEEPGADAISFQRRFKLWKIAFGLALLAAGIRSPMLLLYFWAFPAGLMYALGLIGKSLDGLFIGWAIYGVASFVILICPQKAIFYLLFVGFCLMLLLNVAGCHEMQGSLPG
jgi:hypothetical protein